MKRPASIILLVMGALVTVLCAAGALGAIFTIAGTGPEKELVGALLATLGGAAFGVGLLVLRKGLKVPAVATGIAAALAIVFGVAVMGNKPTPAVSRNSATATDSASASSAQKANSGEGGSETTNSPSNTSEDAPYPAVKYTKKELEDMEEEQDAFAHDLVMEAAQKLVDEGVISNIDGNGLFPFDGQYGSTDMSIEYKDKKKGKALTNSWSHVENLDGLIVARAMFEEMYGERQEICEVCDKYGMFGNYKNELIDSVPRFYPAECQNHTEFGLDDNHPELWGLFADSLEDCKYLIVYGAFESKREEDFYIQGDRVTISTLVILIDAQSREIVAIEDIGCDTPPASKAKSGIGETLDTEARKFILETLLASAK